jgi:3'-phosphoadenosine 5'-phosphosulfate sulfotransferase (PAPS reductase)/FAD synthetase
LNVIDELQNVKKSFRITKGFKALCAILKIDHVNFNMKKIRGMGLSVGSRKVESTHRSRMQKRLKKPGTW